MKKERKKAERHWATERRAGSWRAIHNPGGSRLTQSHEQGGQEPCRPRKKVQHLLQDTLLLNMELNPEILNLNIPLLPTGICDVG